MTKPTAEEALEWLGGNGHDLEFSGTTTRDARYEVIAWNAGKMSIIGIAPTPLEAIRNAMKGESDVLP